MARVTYTLTATELAALTHRLVGDALPFDHAAQADLGASVEQLRVAEERLLARGLLVRASLQEEVGVDTEIGFVLASTLAPDVVCVLRIMHRDGEAQTRYFSFTAESIACNYVDSQEQHVFAELAHLDEVVAEMLLATGVEPGPALAQDGTAQMLESLMQDAQTVALLMVVVDPARPEADVQTLSWLVARGGLWLTVPSSESGTPQARPIDPAGLRQVLTTILAPLNPYSL